MSQHESPKGSSVGQAGSFGVEFVWFLERAVMGIGDIKLLYKIWKDQQMDQWMVRKESK